MNHRPLENVRRLAEFLGLKRSDENIASIVRTCSFDNMKKADLEFKDDFPGRRTKDGESAIFRKG